jgi:hypothetical protein
MHLGVRHPRDRIRRDDSGVAAGAMHVQAVALGDQAVGRDGAVAQFTINFPELATGSPRSLQSGALQCEPDRG